MTSTPPTPPTTQTTGNSPLVENQNQKTPPKKQQQQIANALLVLADIARLQNRYGYQHHEATMTGIVNRAVKRQARTTFLRSHNKTHPAFIATTCPRCGLLFLGEAKRCQCPVLTTRAVRRHHEQAASLHA